MQKTSYSIQVEILPSHFTMSVMTNGHTSPEQLIISDSKALSLLSA